MGFYIDRENYIRQFAETHYDVLHNQPSGQSGLNRQSFFRINDDEEWLAASQNWIHFPCVVMKGISGSLVNQSDSIRQLNANTIMFLQKMQLESNDPGEARAISQAYDETFDVLTDFISKVQHDLENDECFSTFKNIDPERFRWQQVGPVGDQLYGWILTFADETKALAMNYEASHFI